MVDYRILDVYEVCAPLPFEEEFQRLVVAG